MGPVTDLSTQQAIPPPVIGSISQFFTNLLNQGITPMALAAAVFFFAWAAILYMSAGTENTQRLLMSKLALYVALTGLALALLSSTIAGIVNTAAAQSGGTPPTATPQPTLVPIPPAPFPPQPTRVPCGG